MFPYISQIAVRKESSLPVYLQVANNFIGLIRTGQIVVDTKLPSIRKLSRLLKLHPKTIVAAYEEIVAQGWIVQQPRKGFYVNTNLPKLKPERITAGIEKISYPVATGFRYNSSKILPHYTSSHIKKEGKLVFNDGFPDVRLAPLDELFKNMRSIANTPLNKKFLGYGAAEGSLLLRQTLSKFLNDTRGLRTDADNILITNGASMGLFIAASIIVNTGDEIIVGTPGYEDANITFKQVGAKIHKVHVDATGIDTDEIKLICRKRKIKMVFIISQHHNPTTVTLSAERRMVLLQLAEQYGFAILEDDYDYDFHFASKPIMPIASIDKSGHTVYIGALTKTLAPVVRIGFMIAPKKFIQDAIHFRTSIDMQGDTILEHAIANMYKNGSISRHIKKSVKLYEQRRDYFCDLLTDELGDHILFDKPHGGLAIWAKFPFTDLTAVAGRAFNFGLFMKDGKIYDTHKFKYKSARLGFASLNFKEQEKAVEILRKSLTL